MSKRQKSAKDLAFEKERAKFRSEIRKLKDCVNNQKIQIDGLNETIIEKDAVINRQNDWIERLLEYTEMSKEDFQKLLNSEKEKEKVRERVLATLGIFGMFRKELIIRQEEMNAD